MDCKVVIRISFGLRSPRPSLFYRLALTGSAHEVRPRVAQRTRRFIELRAFKKTQLEAA